jgi:alkylation response protein AidB-like acyl-CoA dehydrogenase
MICYAAEVFFAARCPFLIWARAGSGRPFLICQVFFADARIPATALVGEEGRGFKYILGAP